MTIEELAREYLISAGLSVGGSVFLKVPEIPPAEYVLIDKIGGGKSNRIGLTRLDVQSRSDISLERAMDINEEVKEAMDVWAEESDQIFACHLNYDNNFTNPARKQYRYQAGFNIYY